MGIYCVQFLKKKFFFFLGKCLELRGVIFLVQLFISNIFLLSFCRVDSEREVVFTLHVKSVIYWIAHNQLSGRFIQ